MRPRVLKASVQDGQTIPCNTSLRIKFNKPIDESFLSQEGAGSITPHIPFEIEMLDNNRILEIKPSSGSWTSNVEYTAIINDNITLDDSKQTLSAPYKLTFTAKTTADNSAPAPVAISPLDNSIDASSQQEIKVSFDAPVDPTTANNSTFTVTQEG